MLQNNEAWKNVKLGTSQDTIGQSGCLLCCYAMIAGNCGRAENPITLNDKFKSRNGYINGALLTPTSLSELYPDIVYGGSQDFKSIEQLRSLLPQNNIVLELDFDSNPNDGIQTHFVLVGNIDNDIHLLDPIWGDCKFTDHYALDAVLKVFLYKRILPPNIPTAQQPLSKDEILSQIELLLEKLRKLK